ncbi:MAG: MATE family efflux transporter [Clostridia bacterium]|nr:MATE family efflux transporter [Clostridia bacterium]
MTKKLVNSIDMTEGPILKKLIRCAVPLIIGNVLSVLFNLADTLVLGIFRGDAAVGAVGSTGAIYNLIIGLAIGLSMGSNVIVAKAIGAKDEQSVKKSIGMSVMLSLILGAVVFLIGFFFSKNFLVWTGVTADRLKNATLYLKVIFCGMPLILLYNFCASILRASGDTLRPMIYISIGGVMNVILNVVFVWAFGMGVEGVAIATVVSNGFAAVMCFRALVRNQGMVKFELKHFKLYKEQLIEVLKVGLPCGVQGCLFSISNVVIQSSINSFGPIVMDGSGYANHFDNIVYTIQNAIAVTTMAFVSQNVGARNMKRVKRTTLTATAFVSVVGLCLGLISLLIVRPALGLITDNQEVIQAAFIKVKFVAFPYFLCGAMEVISFSLRGLGKSFVSMLICIFGSVVLRVAWIEFILPLNRSLEMLYIVYAISWVVTIAILLVAYIVVQKRLAQKINMEKLMEHA